MLGFFFLLIGVLFTGACVVVGFGSSPSDAVSLWMLLTGGAALFFVVLGLIVIDIHKPEKTN